MNRRSAWTRATPAACMLLGLGAPLHAQDVEDFADLSIEELSRIEVSSASRRPEPLSSAPAALFVITGDDIVRSGASSLPEALRIAPNLDVQRVDARQYAVTTRGFQGSETANKLLVLIDGRSVYSTLFSGVFWDLHQVPLDDLERIEVISGPGGTLYGVNAVNGVINVTSRDARDTQGLLLRAQGGADEQTAYARFGTSLGANGGIRAYVSGYNRQGFPAEDERDLLDGGDGVRLGFRSDFGGPDGDFTLQGDVFRHDNDNAGEDSGGNLLARWSRVSTSGARSEVQAYFSRAERETPGVFDKLDIYDLSAQHGFAAGRHQIVVGGGVRMTRDAFINTENSFVLDPERESLWIGNVYAQDRFDLGDGLALTAGVKLEKTSFTGFELLPNARLAWQITPDALLWGAVSRALRTPSRIDRDLTHPVILRAGTFRSEELTAFEAGYRGQPTSNTSLSISVFYNVYDRLRTTRPNPVTVLPVELANGIEGHSYGVEAWGSAQVTPWWRLSAGIATLHKDFRLKPGEADLGNLNSLGNDPDYHWQIGSRMDLSPTLSLDMQLRQYDSRPDPLVPTYTDLDARLGWQVSPAVELYLAGTNLLHERRRESNDEDRGQLVRRIVSLGARLTL